MDGYKKIAELKIKGLVYEDIVSILASNGYKTKVITYPTRHNVTENYHTVKVYKDISTFDF